MTDSIIERVNKVLGCFDEEDTAGFVLAVLNTATFAYSSALVLHDPTIFEAIIKSGVEIG